MKIKVSEHDEQVALTQWISYHPIIKDIAFAIPNGGHRHKAVAVKLKAEGVRAGVPDYCIPIARKPYSSLFIELKAQKGGNVSENQKNVLKALSDAGNCCVVAYGCDDAIKHIEEYLG